jgi:class 3 adenylate cyclase/tetratricopeptide (TPR) repeat protein
MPACPVCDADNPVGARFCNACGARLTAPEAPTPEPAGERRVVTMLFSDVRGSTAMAERLDPEEWTDVMNDAYEHLITPVYRYEGTVARLMGDAILAFFGAPRAHEDDPQRAVMAGLEIVGSIAPFRDRLARERDLDLNVRVGINTGPVVVGEVGSDLRREYTAMGDAVNVAARMEQTAEPGTVQITEDTYRLVHDLFDVEPLGGVELKGKSRPVRSYRVRGRLASPWKVRAARPLEAALIGRDREIGVIGSVLRGVDRQGGSVVVITGDPGLGKSRLVDEAKAIWADLVPGDDLRWDTWQCVPYDTMQPYAQYRRVIRERADIAETDGAETVREKIAELMKTAPAGWEERSERVARALLGVEREDEPRLEGERFQREVTELLVGSTLSQGGRRLIVFEDLHWCDHASLELIRATVRLVGEAPIVYLITFRPDRAAASWRFKEWVETELPDRSNVIELAPLSREQSDRLIGELLPLGEAPDAVTSRIIASTEGNPLFVQEVARAMIDRGVVEPIEGGWRLAGDPFEVAIPDSVQSLITAGLDRLPERARATLQAASVIGRSFDGGLLRAVVDGEAVEGDLDELVRRDLIWPTAGGSRSEFTFRHALTAEAAYGSLLLKRRRELHRRVAEAVRAASDDHLDDAASLLAHHFRECGDDEQTLVYAERAGDAAARLYAHVEAGGHYRNALTAARRLGVGSPRVRSLYERRGTALELAGRYDDAIDNYEEMRTEARDRGDESFELAAATRIALLYSTPTPKFDPERGRRLSGENVAMARRLGDRRAEARALWNIVVANVYGGGDGATAVEAGEASLAIARELGDREQLAFTLNDVARAHMANAEFATAAERLYEARTLWEDIGNGPMLGENLTVTGNIHALHGDDEAALADARRALAISEEIDNPWGQSIALMSIYRAQIMRGELGAAIRSLERCRELGERGGFSFAGIGTRADLAKVHAYVGDGAGALGLANEALEIADEQLPPAASVAHAARAEALIVLGDASAAQEAIDAVDPTKLPEPDRTFILVSSERARSRLALDAGDPAKAGAIARELVERLRSAGVQVLVAEGLVALGRALTAAGRIDDAERALAEAIESAERTGERRVLWEALALSSSLHAERGDHEAALDLRRRAATIVEGIAEGLDRDLRARFLSQDDVRAILEPQREGRAR